VHASTSMPACVLAGVFSWCLCRCMPPPPCLHLSWLVSLLVTLWVHASTYMPARVLAGALAAAVGGLVGACLHLHACTCLGWCLCWWLGGCMPPPTCPARVLAGALAPAAGGLVGACLHLHACTGLGGALAPAAGGLVGACLHLHACTCLGWRVSGSSRWLGGCMPPPTCLHGSWLAR
jgi:hypothetical protein